MSDETVEQLEAEITRDETLILSREVRTSGKFVAEYTDVSGYEIRIPNVGVFRVGQPQPVSPATAELLTNNPAFRVTME